MGGEGDECVKKKTVQQAQTETNPKPGKEDEDDHNLTLRTASRSILYIHCGAGQGAAPKQCDITRIGRSLWALATTRHDRHGRKQPYVTSGKTRPSCGIVSLRIPQYESPCTELPGRAPETG